MKIDFQKIAEDVDEAVKLVTNAKTEDDKSGASQSLDFYNGEHFGKTGEYWTGPRPADSNSPAALDKVKKEFASKNAIKEVVKGHRDGVISREPEWSFTVKRALAKKGDIINGVKLTEDEQPTSEEQARIRDLNAALTTWWNENDILGVLQRAVKDMLVTRRATLRLYFPPTELVNGKFPKFATLEDALKKLFLLNHSYECAGVFRDDASMKRIGVFTSEDEGQTSVEATYLDAQGNTIIQIARKDKDAARVPYTPQSKTQSIFSGETQRPATEAAAIPLGGRLAMFEMCLEESLVSEQMRQGNKSLNKAKTLRGHVLNEAGFPETTFLNVNLPGVLKDDPNRPGGKVFIADPIQRGSSVTNSWQGIEWTDDSGAKHVANPEIHERDIPSLQAFIESERADYQDILEESGQVHKLQAGDAEASALSRIQSKAAFGTSLLPTVSQVNAAVRWACETVVAFASWLIDSSELYADLRANADCRVDTGPVLPDEIAVWEGLVEKEYVSRARLQRLVGVEDTAAEDETILAEREKFKPMQSVQLQRAQIGLQADQKASQSDAAIRDRLNSGAQGAQDVGGVQ